MNGNLKSIKVVPKGWGHEKIIVNNDQYCGKMLYIIKGHKTSFHFHRVKHETLYVEQGKVQIYFSDENDKVIQVAQSDDPTQVLMLFAPGGGTELSYIILKPGDKFEIPRGRGHRIVALEDTKLYEFSTHHDDSDMVRIINGDTLGASK